MIQSGETYTCPECGRVVDYSTGKRVVLVKGDWSAGHQWGLLIGVTVITPELMPFERFMRKLDDKEG